MFRRFIFNKYFIDQLAFHFIFGLKSIATLRTGGLYGQADRKCDCETLTDETIVYKWWRLTHKTKPLCPVPFLEADGDGHATI